MCLPFLLPQPPCFPSFWGHSWWCLGLLLGSLLEAPCGPRTPPCRAWSLAWHIHRYPIGGVGTDGMGRLRELRGSISGQRPVSSERLPKRGGEEAGASPGPGSGRCLGHVYPRASGSPVGTAESRLVVWSSSDTAGLAQKQRGMLNEAVV